MYPNNFGEEVTFHNIIVSSTFILVCFIGGIASIYPSTCGKIFSPELLKKSNSIHSSKKSNSRGHHYPCEKYLSHTLKIGKKYFCATCSGLLIGAIFGIIGSIWFFSEYFQAEDVLILAPLGLLGVSFGLFQSIIPKTNGALSRLFAGISLVLGAFILLVSLDQASNSTFVDLFFVAISIFWIITKITLSQREHRLTCLNCSKKHCDLEKRGIDY
jgi:hypothetical protein